MEGIAGILWLLDRGEGTAGSASAFLWDLLLLLRGQSDSIMAGEDYAWEDYFAREVRESYGARTACDTMATDSLQYTLARFCNLMELTPAELNVHIVIFFAIAFAYYFKYLVFVIFVSLHIDYRCASNSHHTLLTSRRHTTPHNTTQHHITSQHHTTLHNTTQHNTTQHYTTQHNTTQHNTTQHNTTQHNTTQHNTTQHNTTQHNTTQRNTTQHNATQRNTTLLHAIKSRNAIVT